MYEYPNFPVVADRQTTTEPLRDGRAYPVTTEAPHQTVAKNTVPDPYTPLANQPVYGSQVFGQGKGYEEWPQPLDIVQRYYHIGIQEGLFYRTNGFSPSYQYPTYAAITPSITTPSMGARFVNARGRGDVYGA